MWSYLHTRKTAQAAVLERDWNRGKAEAGRSRRRLHPRCEVAEPCTREVAVGRDVSGC